MMKNVVEFSAVLGSPLSVIEKYDFPNDDNKEQFKILNKLIFKVCEMGIEIQNKLSDGEVTANRDVINLLSQREREELLDGLLLIYFNVIEQQKADIKDDELSKRQKLAMKMK